MYYECLCRQTSLSILPSHHPTLSPPHTPSHPLTPHPPQVGAATETELKDKKLRYEDALNSVKSALEMGVVPGGGACMLYMSCDEVLKVRVLCAVCVMYPPLPPLSLFLSFSPLTSFPHPIHPIPIRPIHPSPPAPPAIHPRLLRQGRRGREAGRGDHVPLAARAHEADRQERRCVGVCGLLWVVVMVVVWLVCVCGVSFSMLLCQCSLTLSPLPQHDT